MEILGKNLATVPQVQSARQNIVIVQANGGARTDLGRHFAHQDAKQFKSVTPHALVFSAKSGLFVGAATAFA